MKVRKFLVVSGTVTLFIGFVLFLSAYVVILSHTRYTWSAPYTSFERDVLSLRTLGVVLMIWGTIVEILYVSSRRYEDKNIQDVTKITSSSRVCPKCGINVDKSLAVCPNCHAKMSNYN